MRILFCTQKIDRNDDILGVYHEWVRRLALQIERLSVICLFRGAVELPHTVQIQSLGKEIHHADGGASYVRDRVQYVFRFYRALIHARGTYDVVFVHMNPEYVLLGALFWKVCRVPIVFWYNHPHAGFLARIAFRLSSVVLHTSPFAYVAGMERSIKMPVGIDTNRFAFRTVPQNNSMCRLVYVGRLSPVKHVDDLLRAVGEMVRNKKKIVVEIYGKALDRLEDLQYEQKLHDIVREEKIAEHVAFRGSVPNREVPRLYQHADCTVNLTTTGSMDKAIFEAMSMGVPVFTSNKALRGDIADLYMCEEGNAHSVAVKLEQFMEFDSARREAEGRSLRALVVEKHSIQSLIDRLLVVFERSVSK